MRPDAALPTFRLDDGTSIAQASPWHTQPVTLVSPALDVMTDLTRVKAATIRPDQSLQQAELAMIYQGVRMLLVVNTLPVLDGLVTLNDLHGERQMSLVHERNLHFDEIRVADVMTRLVMLDAIDFDAMGTALVGNVIATLKRFGRDHLLVVQTVRESGARQVRGVISRTQVERQLDQRIDITPIASSFSEIERALAKG